MTVVYCKLYQVVITIAAAVPDVVLLPEQINTSPGTWHAAIGFAKAFLFVQKVQVFPEEFAFSWQG